MTPATAARPTGTASEIPSRQRRARGPSSSIGGRCRNTTIRAAATAYPITEPVEIRTYSRRVRQARQTVVDLMLAEHYGSCQTCGRNGSCELQDLAAEYA